MFKGLSNYSNYFKLDQTTLTTGLPWALASAPKAPMPVGVWGVADPPQPSESYYGHPKGPGTKGPIRAYLNNWPASRALYIRPLRGT